MTEPQQHTTRPLPKRNKIPFLPSEVINLIIAHYTGPYALRISYTWWDFDGTIRVHNIPSTSPLTLVSRAFSTIAAHQLRLAFTGNLMIDYESAESMHLYEPDATSSDSTLVKWLFENVHTVQITGYPAARQRAYTVDMRHWPALRRVEIIAQGCLLPYMREVDSLFHDAEVRRIAGLVGKVLRVEDVRDWDSVEVGCVFPGCWCGTFCLVRLKRKEGVWEEGGMDILHSRNDWMSGRVIETQATSPD